MRFMAAALILGLVCPATAQVPPSVPITGPKGDTRPGANGARLDPVTEGETPFLGAVKWSRFRGAKALLELGADPNYRDGTGKTALHYMLKKGSDAKHFKMLVRHGARGDLPDDEGVTAAEIMGRKRDLAFRKLAAQLSVG